LRRSSGRPTAQQPPVIVENIGVIPEELEQMRTELGHPTMNIAVFADWCDTDNRYHPASYDENSVAYTTTHDTNTVVGRYEELEDEQRECLHEFVDYDGDAIHWAIVDAVWETDSPLAIAQVQDVLGLGADDRFNSPGTIEDNWTWRVSRDAFIDDVARRLYEVTERSDRLTE
jgi:4-alpha-glucanotransferase